MDERLAVIKNVLIKKIVFILLFGILCSGLLVFEKALFTDFYVKTGSFQIYHIIQVDDSKVRSNPYYEFDYRGYFLTNHNIDSIITSLEKNANPFLVSVNPNWDKLSRLQQVEWLRKKLVIIPYRDNTFEISFYLNANEVKDIVFLQENADSFLDSVLLQFSNNIKMIKPGTIINPFARNMLIPKSVPLNKRDILKKYGVIGFMFGIIIAAMAFSIKALRDYK